MKNISIKDFNPGDFLLSSVKVSGFDIIATSSNGEKIRILDGLPEVLLESVKLLDSSGNTIDTSSILSSIDAQKLGLDISVLGSLIEGNENKTGEKKGKEQHDSIDKEKFESLVAENQKLKEQLENSESPNNPVEIVNVSINKPDSVVTDNSSSKTDSSDEVIVKKKKLYWRRVGLVPLQL
ncbi:hypothetical protein IC756_23510 (plasmid) [Escherichia coli]|uniref:hypothetical protein n=1 Tax=Escherichia coli TaxID=562 RepID=UPI00166A8355|nr:hypothetical protein [Escherichia coli]QNT49708.1 hypothetical protein IC756_23510 [Escherichia coli]